MPCAASSGTLAQHRFALLSLILDYVVAIDPRSPEGSLTATSHPLPAMATRLKGALRHLLGPQDLPRLFHQRVTTACLIECYKGTHRFDAKP